MIQSVLYLDMATHIILRDIKLFSDSLKALLSLLPTLLSA